MDTSPCADMIAAHRRWMTVGFSPNTVRDACELLTRVDRDLAEVQTAADDEPGGLATAWPEELEAWLARPCCWATPDGRPRTRSRQTVATYRLHLVRCYRWAVRAGWITYDPSTDLIAPKVNEPIPQPATDAQVAYVMQHAEDPFWLHSVLAAYAGFRPSDIAYARREHFTSETITVRGKGDKPAILPCDAQVWEAVRDLPDGPIARRPRGKSGPITAQDVTNDACYYLHHKLRLDITLRSFRAWYCTTMMERYGDVRVVAELMRHESLNTLKRYDKVVVARKRAALLTLPRFGGRAAAAGAAAQTRRLRPAALAG